MTNTNVIDTLAIDLFDQINNELVCNLIDVGIDPGLAWEIVMVDMPLSEYIAPDFGITDETILNAHDDVILIHQ